MDLYVHSSYVYMMWCLINCAGITLPFNFLQERLDCDQTRPETLESVAGNILTVGNKIPVKRMRFVKSLLLNKEKFKRIGAKFICFITCNNKQRKKEIKNLFRFRLNYFLHPCVSFSYKKKIRISIEYIGFQVLTSVPMKSSIFWDITPCSPLKVNRRLG
jgi:hypothetical protein